MAAILTQSGNLRSLSLRHNQIGDGVRDLAVALETNTTLSTLDLLGNSIAAGAHGLAASLSRNSTLTALNLCNNHIAGALEFAAALERNTTITSLNLNGNPIYFIHGAGFSKALASNFTLIELLGVPGVEDLISRNQAVMRSRKEQVLVVSLLCF